MLQFRIVAAAATLLVLSAAADANAQTTASQPVGSPLQLLTIVTQPGKAQAKPRAKTSVASVKRTTEVAARKQAHKHFAALRRLRPHLPVQVAAATPVPTPAPTPDPIWPAAKPAMAADIPPPASLPVAAPSAPDPRELVVAGQTVRVTPPDQVNEIDLAANDAAPQANDAAPTNSTANTAPLHDIAEPDSKWDSINALIANEPQPPNEVGSTSWFLQVLAALGGAVTAGTVAWFLIGGTPQRTYG